MSVKSILCIFGGVSEELNALNVAFALAELHQAQVRFLHISPNITGYIGMYGGAAMIEPDIVNSFEGENKARLMRARQHVASFANKHRVTLDASVTPLHHVAAKFVHRSGGIADIVAEEGRLSDLIVMSRGIAAPETSEDPHVVTALFDTGRPVVLVPVPPHPAIMPWQDRTVAIAWDGSLEASRAIYHAIPYLERAETLYVLCVRPRDVPHNAEAMRGVLDYLEAHISGAPQLVFINSQSESIADVIQRKAKDLGVELLIMGAFGHSRFREMLLGGTTKAMVEHAEIPLLLAH